MMLNFIFYYEFNIVLTFFQGNLRQSKNMEAEDWIVVHIATQLSHIFISTATDNWL